MNQLLFDNKQALNEIFESYKERPRGFTYRSAQNLLNPLDEDVADGDQLVPELTKIFSFSMMTILREREESQRYHQLFYVEFLDFLCRVSIELWAKFESTKADIDKRKGDIQDKVFQLLKLIWDYRAANPTKLPERKLKKGESKLAEFPELVPVMDLDDEDGEL